MLKNLRNQLTVFIRFSAQPRISAPSSRRLLAWDSFSCHIMDAVKNKVKENNTNMVVAPGGCTKYIQAPDVVGTHLSRSW